MFNLGRSQSVGIVKITIKKSNKKNKVEFLIDHMKVHFVILKNALKTSLKTIEWMNLKHTIICAKYSENTLSRDGGYLVLKQLGLV